MVIRKNLPAGLSKVTVKGKKLKPDIWKVVGTAVNDVGTSPRRRARLTVVGSRG